MMMKQIEANEITEAQDAVEAIVNRDVFDNPDIARYLRAAKDNLFRARVLADEEAGLR